MKPTNPFYSRGALALVLGGLLLVMGACGGGGNSKNVEVAEPRLVQDPSGERSFAGLLVNHRAQALSIAQVEVALYDDSGSRIETVKIEVKDVPAQDSVTFSGIIDSDRPFRQAQVQSVLTP